MFPIIKVIRESILKNVIIANKIKTRELPVGKQAMRTQYDNTSNQNSLPKFACFPKSPLGGLFVLDSHCVNRGIGFR